MRNRIDKPTTFDGRSVSTRIVSVSSLRAVLIAAITVIVFLALTSCFEYAEEYTFNPDGSGTFSMDIGMGAMLSSMMELGDSMSGLGTEDTSSEADATGGDADAPPSESVTADDNASEVKGGDETDSVEVGNPFAEMQAEADRINKEGDPKGLITGAEFKQYDKDDMKHSVFTVNLADMTKAIDAVEGEWWKDAPGAGVEGDPNKVPFKIEKLENGNILFTKEIAVPDGNGVIPYPADEKPVKPNGESTTSEGKDDTTDSADVIGMFSLSDTAYAEEAKTEAKPKEKPKSEGSDEFEKALNKMMEGLGATITEGLKEGAADVGVGAGEDSAVNGASAEEEVSMEGADMDAFGAEFAKQMFAGKNYTITIHAPIIVDTNGTILEPSEADTSADAPNVKPSIQTVQWVIPMSDMMSGEGYYKKLTAEIKLKEKISPIKRLTGLLTGGETEDSTIPLPIIMALLVVGLIIIVALVKKRKRKSVKTVQESKPE